MTRSHYIASVLAVGLTACGASAPAPTAKAPAAAPAPSPAPAAPTAAATFSACDDATLAPDLAPLVGTWHGAGWIEIQPGQRHDFTQVERVRCALGGQLLTIDGQARSGAGELVHQAFGVIAPRGDEPGHEMRAYAVGRPTVDSPLERGDDGSLTWRMSQGPVELRFTIRVEDGVWRETGEASFQDSPWRPFFSTELRRDPGAAPSAG